MYTCCFGKEEEGHEEGEQGRCWECYETPTNAFSESFKFTVPDVSPAASSSTPSNSSLPSDSSDFPSDSSGSSEPFSDSGAAPPPSPSPSSSSAPEGGLLEISYAERSGFFLFLFFFLFSFVFCLFLFFNFFPKITHPLLLRHSWSFFFTK